MSTIFSFEDLVALVFLCLVVAIVSVVDCGGLADGLMRATTTCCAWSRWIAGAVAVSGASGVLARQPRVRLEMCPTGSAIAVPVRLVVLVGPAGAAAGLADVGVAWCCWRSGLRWIGPR